MKLNINNLVMTGFELRTSSVRSDRFTNECTNTARDGYILVWKMLLQQVVKRGHFNSDIPISE